MNMDNVRTFLVVEDEPTICVVCQRVLAAKGFQVDIAINGKIAQDMIDKKSYDCCLLDIRTPAMNGKELYQWLKEKHSEFASKVIFTTGDILGGDTRDFLEQAGRLFLPKPFAPDELREIVNQTLKEA